MDLMDEFTVPMVLTVKTSARDRDLEAASRVVADLEAIRRGSKIDHLDAWFFMEAGNQHLDGNDRYPVSLTPVGDHPAVNAGEAGRVLVGVDVYAPDEVTAQRQVRDGLTRHFGTLNPQGDVADRSSHVTNVHLVGADASTGQVGPERWEISAPRPNDIDDEEVTVYDPDDATAAPIYEGRPSRAGLHLVPAEYAGEFMDSSSAEEIAVVVNDAGSRVRKARVRTSIDGVGLAGAPRFGVAGPR